ncbi:MAG: hypothetical protein HDR01_11750 [Lachnospiraceae bacterium]|nr:hypothetical protein [Lachnospiraceae bacterium]
MAFTQIQKLQLNNQVDRILHMPGNFRGGNLEMTMVFDYAMDIGQLKEDAGQIIAALKAHSPVFQNVRFNGVKWKGDSSIINQVTPMTFVQIGKFFEEENPHVPSQAGAKNLVILLEQLKLFHARSKLILILTQGQYQISDKEAAKSALTPFLKQKILFLESDRIRTGMQIFMELI